LKKFPKLFLSVLFLGVFLYVITLNLDAQGPNYDELLLAVPSFTYKGIPVAMFNEFSLAGVPVFANSILGGIKTAIYGSYLVLTDSRFTITGWRFMAIALYTLGLIFFIFKISHVLKRREFLLLVLLIITDIDILINVRFDFGPVAMSFLYKYIFLGLAINTELNKKLNSFLSFLMGLATGLIIFDKLSAVVFLIPYFMFLFHWIKKAILISKNLYLNIIGLFIGLFPIIITNIYYLIRENRLFSTVSLVSNTVYKLSTINLFIKSYFYLGSGFDSIRGMLGQDIIRNTGSFQFYILVLFILVLFIFNFLFLRQKRKIHLSLLFLLSFIFIGLALYLMPQKTYERHFLLGTPFQYISVILIFDLINKIKLNKKLKKLLYTSCIIVFTVWISVRTANLILTANYLASGKSSLQWDPSFNEIGVFADKNKADSYFIASDWGVATQIFAYSNGSQNLIFELFPGYHNSGQLRNVIKNSRKKIIYIIGLNPPTQLYRANSQKIETDAKSATYLESVPLEQELRDLKAIRIKKYKVI